MKNSSGNIEAIYPLTPTQEGMLFHSIYDEQSKMYFEQDVCRINGKFAYKQFFKAWDMVIEKYAILRTSFLWANTPRMLQVVHKTVKSSGKYFDWRNRSTDEIALECKKYIDAERQEGFRLDKTPLFKLTLFRIGEDEYIFLLAVHHLIIEGWSRAIILNDVFRYYKDIQAGRNSVIEPVPHFSEYIRAIEKQNKGEGEKFWRQKLAGINSPLQVFPRNYNQNSENGTTSKITQTLLSETLSGALVQQAKEHRLTISCILAASWSLLLKFYSGSDDILFGYTVSGRNVDIPGIENMVGVLINTILFRTQIEEEKSIFEFLQNVQNDLIEMKDYELTALVDIKKWSGIKSNEQIFDSIFLYENYPFDSELFSADNDFIISNFEHYIKINYPITFIASPGKEFNLSILYDCASFSDDYIQRILEHLKFIIEQIVINQHLKTSKLSDIECARNNKLKVINSFPQGGIEAEKFLTIHDLITRQAEVIPFKYAVIYNDESLTFEKLNAQANKVADFLIAKGVRPEVRIAILMERSAYMLVVILGILKSGGTYVPIDIRYPETRINELLKDSGAKIVIANQPKDQTKLNNECIYIEIKNILEDESWSSQNPNLIINPDNSAYIIYTSGSTGKPKGVIVEHRALTNLWRSLYHEIYSNYKNESLVVSLNASISFDASIKQIITLAGGNTICLIPEEARLSPDELWKYIKQKEINVLDCVPTQLKTLLDAGSLDEKSAPLKICLPGGEAIDKNMWEKLSSKRHITFYNMYGPTECTGDASYRRIEVCSYYPSIGTPLSNISINILDKKLRMVHEGVTGDVYISGICTARGYVNNPELTADSFIPNPYSMNGERMYRTGDLGRILPDGTLDFMGRKDGQIKIRGYRIELDEIENLIKQYPDIKDAAVVTQETINGDKRIIAFIKSEAIEIGNLQKFLKERLPQYMIPSSIVPLHVFPISSNGKVDRRLLTQMPVSEDSVEKSINKTQTEELLCLIFSDVLKRKCVDKNDDFFDLGGHSLNAAQLAARIRNTFNIEIPIREIFLFPVVKELAARIEFIKYKSQKTKQFSIYEAKINKPDLIDLSYPQQRLWLLNKLSPDNKSYNINTILEIKGSLRHDILEETIAEIIDRHEALRTVFVEERGIPKQKILKEVNFNLTLITTNTEEELENIIESKYGMFFRLDDWPLFNFSLIKVNQNYHVLIILMHHIITDGWSFDIFSDELSSIYSAKVKGQPPVLKELAVQYSDYSLWQRKVLSGEELKRQLNYWLEELKEYSGYMKLPTDFPRMTTQTFNGMEYKSYIDLDLSSDLEVFNKSQSVTPFMSFLTAYHIMMHKYTGSNDIAVGIPIANRSLQELEQLIGFFVNTLVIRTTVGSETSIEIFLNIIREKILNAFDNQELPFDLLVERIHPERDLSYSPIFQTAFVYQNSRRESFEVADLVISNRKYKNTTAKYDITLLVLEKESGYELVWEYNTDLFKKSSIAGMSSVFEKIIREMIRDKKQKIRELQILPIFEFERLTKMLTNDSVASKLCAHEIFEHIVSKYAEKDAILFSNDAEGEILHITYNELNKRANQAARYLQRMGVKPDVLVAISMERSIEMIVYVMAILKSGGAFLPIDSTYPLERIEFMLKNSNAKILITSKKLNSIFSNYTNEILYIDELRAEAALEQDGNLQIKMHNQNLAYVIYTSGSTGKPKGVLLEHKGLSNLALAQQEILGISPDDRIFQFSSLSFDASIWEIVMALLNGAALCVIPREIIVSGHLLMKSIDNFSSTVITIPPSVLNYIPSRLSNGEPSIKSLRTIIVAGEKCPIELAVIWSKNRKFVNAYGPTETTVCASMYSVDGEIVFLPIGTPINNFQLYVLGADLQLLPAGVPGELYIGGKGLARGYIGMPELTAQKFLPNPFTNVPGERIYKSGDLVKIVDGKIEFLGRMDEQVKIRGFRIELGEIESVIETHENIKHSAVKVIENKSGEKQLAAYLLLKNNELNIGDLKSFLRKQLPEHMVPGIFMPLKEFPLNSSNKIDKKRLPDPNIDNTISEASVGPRNKTEDKLIQIMTELLKLDSIGIYDNFFDLGGHSLTASQLTSRIKESFNIELPLKTIFEAPRAADLAALVDLHKGYSESEVLQPLKADDIESILDEITNLTDAEAAMLLNQEGGKSKNA